MLELLSSIGLEDLPLSLKVSLAAVAVAVVGCANLILAWGQKKLMALSARLAVAAGTPVVAWLKKPSRATVAAQEVAAERQSLALAMREQSRVNVQLAEEIHNLRKELK